MTNMFRALARTALLATLLTAGIAQHAQAQQAGGVQANTVQEGDGFTTAPHIDIDVQGVDLTTPDGVTTARHRVANAARAVCQTVIDPDGFHLTYSACVQTARTQGNQQLEGLRQQAMARANTNRSLAMQNAAKSK